MILPVGIALSAETDFDRLLEQILIEAKIAANTDAGTLYLRNDDKLEFAIVLTDSLGVALGGTTGNPITFPPLSLYDADGNPEHEKRCQLCGAHRAVGQGGGCVQRAGFRLFSHEKIRRAERLPDHARC